MEEKCYKRIKNYYDYNRLPIWMILIIFILSVVWISCSTANVPVMDFWRYICDLTTKVFRGEFSFSDMWQTMGGHREGFAYLLIALNIRYLHLNLSLWIYIGLILTLISCIFLYNYYKKVIITDYNRNGSYDISKILFFIIPLVLFCFNQWEIFTLAFSFSFALRRALYLLMFVLMEKVIFNYNSIKKYMFEIIVLLLFIMLFISGGYLPAFVGAIIFCFILDSIFNYREKGFVPKQYCFITLVIVFSMIVYSLGLSGVPQDTDILNIFSVELIKGILIMLGSSVVDTSYVDNLGINFSIYIGIIILVIYLFALFLYFYTKMWKKTYVPIMLILYSGINIFIINFARASKFGSSYLSSSRYSYETIMGIIGVSCILIRYMLSVNFKTKKSKVSIVLIGIISIMLLSSYVAEFRMAKFRKSYQNNLIDIMYNIDSYSDDELSVFQANEPEQVRNGVKLMRDYNLGVFKYLNN